ncbi:MAG: hypothetical protein HOP28_17930 [Gemmatimonadales bacterium]|nr:hypothetical protein [Gemmatimonadales bacterium]
MRIALLVVALSVGTGCGEAKTAPGPDDCGIVPCGGPPSPVPRVQNLTIDDVGNAGNGTDLEVAFEYAGDLTLIREFRIVVTREGGGRLLVEQAAALSPDRYVAVVPTFGATRLTLPAGARDAQAELLQEGITYRAFVVSVSRLPYPRVSSGTESSRAITLAKTTLKITYLWNAGILIEDDTAKVVIDGLQRRTDGFFVDPPQEPRQNLESGMGAFANIRVALGTHIHEDHILAAAARDFLNLVPTAWFVGPTALVDLLNGLPRTVAPNVPRGQRATILVNGVRIGILHVRHFNQFGMDFGAIDNYAYLVELGGKKILHLGDVDVTTANLSGFGLAAEGIDIVVIPAFGTLLTAASRDVINATIAPDVVIATHLRAAEGVADSTQVKALYPNAIVFRTPLDVTRM